MLVALCRQQCSCNILDLLDIWSQLYIGVSRLPRNSQHTCQYKQWLEQGTDQDHLHRYWMYGHSLSGACCACHSAPAMHVNITLQYGGVFVVACQRSQVVSSGGKLSIFLLWPHTLSMCSIKWLQHLQCLDVEVSCVVAGSLVSALAVIYVCSRVTRWHKTDVRDTRHMVKPCHFAKCSTPL